MRQREEEAAHKIETERFITKQQRAAKLRHALQVMLRALVTAAKVIGVATLALLGLLMAMVAVLGALNSSPARRRRRRR
jgi:hypothetical protein